MPRNVPALSLRVSRSIERLVFGCSYVKLALNRNLEFAIRSGLICTVPLARNRADATSMSPLRFALTIYSDIFEERLRLDVRHQPTWAKDVANLASWFKGTSFAHPYGDGPYPTCPINSYHATCAGPDAALPSSEYVYRLTSVGSVIRPTNAKQPYRSGTSSVNFQRLRTAQSATKRRWLPLSEYVNGVLSGYRNCTWWTPSELTWNPTLPSAHKIGMPNGWVAPTAALLRVKRDERFVALANKVPTPIDAFESSVFLATVVPGARYGIAIDLSNPKFLDDGHPEVVATNIPVALVEILPVAVDEEERVRFPVNLVPILPDLLAYYRSK